MKGMTLVRILIQLSLYPSDVLDDAGVQRLAIGIGLAGQEAIQQSGSAIPNPETEDEFPPSGWLYRVVHPVIADPTPGFPTPVLDKDLRAQRKLMYGAPFVRFVNINEQGATPFSVNIQGVIRCLYLLP